MQTPDQPVATPGRLFCSPIRLRGARGILPVLVAVVALLIGGCSQRADMSTIETDAHGYLCQKCGAKFYTGRREFLESKCPKCQQETLVDVVGYMCQKDNHLTIRAKVASASECEVCGVLLKNSMVSPREKDLKAWGATKTAVK
jgi:hypothetical protein